MDLYVELDVQEVVSRKSVAIEKQFSTFSPFLENALFDEGN